MSNSMNLGENQKAVLDFIAAEQSAGRPCPSHREIASHLGFASSFAAGYHVRALIKKGLLDASFHKARSLKLASTSSRPRSAVAHIPLFGSIPAGFGQDREQESEGCVTVDVATIGFKPTRNTFALRVVGDSMIGRHVCNGDIVILEHGPEPRHGQIVAALIDRKSTLKTFLLKNNKPFLKAENPKYPDLIPSEELMIQGVFRGLIGSNKLVSAVASKLRKPAAFHEVPAGNEAAFLHPLPNKWLPGVGPKTSVRLNAAGLAQISHVAVTPLSMLELLLGNQASTIHQFSHGIDERPLIPLREPQKSFGHQETFATDLTDEEYIEAVLRKMADDLFATVREEGRSIRTLTVKVRYNDMGEDQVSESLLEPTDLETDVYGLLHTLLRKAWKRRVSLRLVSLKLSNLYHGPLLTELPFLPSSQRHDSNARLAAQIDALRKSHGHSIILRGHDFRLRSPPADPIVRPAVRPSVQPCRGRASSSGTNLDPFVPLRVHSHYSFLDSTLTPDRIVGLAKQHGLKSVALTDTGNLHGAVEFVLAAKAAGVKPILGTELRVEDKPLLLYVESAHGYHNLCRLLSRHAERTAKDGDEGGVAAQERLPFLLSEFDGLTQGLVAVSSDTQMAARFPGAFYSMVTSRDTTAAFSAVACPPVHYATPAERQRFDILQSIRTLTLLRGHHPDKRPGGRLHFRTPAEMSAGCKEHPEWSRHTLEIAERCNFELPFGKPQFPAFSPPDGSSAKEFLERLVLQGLRDRYGTRSEKFRPQVMEELGIIADVGYEEYFLITWDFLQECRARGIEWITRGSAADSLVCYCLKISGVCPIRFDLYFKRFLNKERMALHKLPDIDIDFAHDFKDDVVKLIFEKYKREHCAVVGGFSTFQAKSAFAEVAKVLGVAERDVRRLTEHFPWSFGGGWVPDEPTPTGGSRLIEMLKASPENRDLPLDDEPFKTALETAAFLDGVPRYPKMHPCGVVLSRQPMHELTPTFIANKGYATTHFDMDSVEAVGLVKMDILAQGGLAAMRDVKSMLTGRGIEIDLERCVSREAGTGKVLLGDSGATEPWCDQKVWEMIASGNARAVHHIESPAMTSLSRMCNVREIDGLIAIVSVIRPGAANEGKKLSFTRRYQGMEPITYPHPSLETCLRSTYGLVVYEEHILQICEAFAGLPPGRADVLRRALNKQKGAVIEEIRGEFITSSLGRGHSPEKTSEVWDLVTGFAGYAFCKAHSTAYGVEAYQSAWLKRYFPAEFMAAVLTNGKGFYDPLVYVLECHRLGLKLLPPSVNEPGPAFVPHGNLIRVPLTRLKGLSDRTSDKVLAAREKGLFSSLADFYHRVTPAGDEFEALIRVGACDEFGDTRTRQFWQAQYLLRTFGSSAEPNQGWLIPPADPAKLPKLPVVEPTRLERLQAETELFGFAASGHPLELFENIAWNTYCPVNRLAEFIGQRVSVCSLVVEQRVHHQITGEPMKFLSLADWTGIIETELFAQTYKTYGLATVRYPVLEIEAQVEAFENGRGFGLRALAARKPRLTNVGV
jgi:SOS regulatory protein LexA